MRGIKNLTMFSRKVSFSRDSRLDLSAPALSQDLSTPKTPGAFGNDGKFGVNGPTGRLHLFLPLFL